MIWNGFNICMFGKDCFVVKEKRRGGLLREEKVNE